MTTTGLAECAFNLSSGIFASRNAGGGCAYRGLLSYQRVASWARSATKVPQARAYRGGVGRQIDATNLTQVHRRHRHMRDHRVLGPDIWFVLSEQDLV